MKMHRDSILYCRSLDGLRSLYNTDHEEPCLLHSTGHVEEDSNHRHDYGLSTIRGSRAVHQQHWKVFQEFVLKGAFVRNDLWHFVVVSVFLCFLIRKFVYVTPTVPKCIVPLR